MKDADEHVRNLLNDVFGEKSSRDRGSFIRAGMNIIELPRLYELICEHMPKRVLEIGMANGTSSIVISEALKTNGGGSLTSIDPYQSKSIDSGGFASQGLTNLSALGLDAGHTLIEKPDYLALPELLADGQTFDFILVDGYHSFDYTFIDVFYADLLLKCQGVLCIHDSTMPAVYKVLKYFEKTKPYRRLSPPTFKGDPAKRREMSNFGVAASVARSFYRRGGSLLGLTPIKYQELRERSTRWNTLIAYQKLAEHLAPERVCPSF